MAWDGSDDTQLIDISLHLLMGGGKRVLELVCT